LHVPQSTPWCIPHSTPSQRDTQTAEALHHSMAEQVPQLTPLTTPQFWPAQTFSHCWAALQRYPSGHAPQSSPFTAPQWPAQICALHSSGVEHATHRWLTHFPEAQASFHSQPDPFPSGVHAGRHTRTSRCACGQQCPELQPPSVPHSELSGFGASTQWFALQAKPFAQPRPSQVVGQTPFRQR
jgi:hypothetical protein